MTKNHPNKFRCVVIGEGTLPIRCSEALVDNGHDLTGIVSTDNKIRKWANGKNIPVHQSIADFLAETSGAIDYVFSIVNSHILRDDILSLPRKGTINYHDGPLPKYAGTHATSWAIMNHEREHAITWHFVTDVVDAGDILKQEWVDIADSDTAHSLNTKCYEAAIRAFNELVIEISNDTCQLTKQNLEERTFFPRFKRPANGGVISWASSSKEISALIRALNFGPHPNPLGAAKAALDGTYLIVSEVSSSDSDAEALSGTINEIDPDFIRVSTGDKEIVLRRFHSLDGAPLTVEEVTKQFGLKTGFRFPELETEQYNRIETSVKETCKSESYWVKRLSELDPAAAPFADSNHTSLETGYEMTRLSLPNEFVEFVKRSPSSASLGVHIVAALGGFLSRLNDNENFDISLHDSSIHDQFAGAGELFADRVPLRLRTDWADDYFTHLESIATEIESVRRHKTFSFDITARYPELSPSVDAPKLTSLPISVFLATDARAEDITPTGDLMLIAGESEASCSLAFDTSKFGKDGAEKFVRYFSSFLTGIAAKPERSLGQIALLNAEEKEQLVVGLNRDRLTVPADTCIHDLFEAQVERTPDATALVSDSHRVSYRELNDRAEKVARRLRNLGVGPEVLVAICVERSVEMIAGILGILKAGGAYVPLDPAYPLARLDQILKDSGSTVLLTRSTTALDLDHSATVVFLDIDEEQDGVATDAEKIRSVKPDNLAYVIYTSGSTGVPKGVAIEHRNAVTFLTWATSVFSVEKLKGTVASTSICFDLSIFEIFGPLSCGGTIILVENILRLPLSPAAGEATLINTVPSAITELLRMKGVPDSVRTVNLAGEPLKTSLVSQIYRTTNVQDVFDLYGPTEDTTYSTYTLRKDGRATIGRPISNTQAYILDRNLELVPPGIPGELYLGGDGLARGYLNRPDLTATRFIENPLDPDTSARIYKTGDLVRYLPSFEIEYLGRVDHQVKIRGFRIELGEIEAVLSSHPGVEGALVVASEDHSAGKRLVAYVVNAGEEKIGTSELREFVKKSLPDFMVPAVFIELDEFPLTPNGKIDRKALPAPTHSIVEPNRSYVAARNEVESELVAIWERLLKVSPIGVHDDFFELGGDSLISVSLFVEIENKFGAELPLSALVGSPTVEKLAIELGEGSSAGSSKYLVPLQTEGEHPPLFCMHAAGGNVLFYRDLANELGKDQPFYGLQARGVTDKSETAHDRVEDMAADYLKEIRSFQETGPYHLCGASFGGLVAFEAARQLIAMGETVGLLALFDTYAPGYIASRGVESKTPPLKSVLFRVKSVKTQLREMGDWKARFEFVRSKAAKVNKKVKRKIAWTKNQFAIEYNKATGRELPPDMMRNHAAIQKAMDTYMPEKFDGDMVLFRASDQPVTDFDQHLGWDVFVNGKVTAAVVKGTHGALTVYPFAADLAAKFKPILSQRAVSTGTISQSEHERAA